MREPLGPRDDAEAVSLAQRRRREPRPRFHLPQYFKPLPSEPAKRGTEGVGRTQLDKLMLSPGSRARHACAFRRRRGRARRRCARAAKDRRPGSEELRRARQRGDRLRPAASPRVTGRVRRDHRLRRGHCARARAPRARCWRRRRASVETPCWRFARPPRWVGLRSALAPRKACRRFRSRGRLATVRVILRIPDAAWRRSSTGSSPVVASSRKTRLGRVRSRRGAEVFAGWPARFPQQRDRSRLDRRSPGARCAAAGRSLSARSWRGASACSRVRIRRFTHAPPLRARRRGETRGLPRGAPGMGAEHPPWSSYRRAVASTWCVVQPSAR
jgi:hypothetical protein